MYKYSFYKEAEKELSKLNNSIKILFAKKLSKIIKDPNIGKDLSNKNNLKLSGLKKVYFYNKKYRIVYEVIKQEIIIHIVSIGKRDDMEVYKTHIKDMSNKNKYKLNLYQNFFWRILKYILDEQKITYNENVDFSETYKEVSKSLNLAPKQHQEQIFKQILGGTNVIISGLAVNLSGLMAIFLYKTFKKQRT